LSENRWTVEKTSCYPKSFKVVNPYYRQDNDARHYFETEEEAEKEADKRNFREAFDPNSTDTRYAAGCALLYAKVVAMKKGLSEGYIDLLALQIARLRHCRRQ
jgi:hypothetical protein